MPPWIFPKASAATTAIAHPVMTIMSNSVLGSRVNSPPTMSESEDKIHHHQYSPQHFRISILKNVLLSVITQLHTSTSSEIFQFSPVNVYSRTTRTKARDGVARGNAYCSCAGDRFRQLQLCEWFSHLSPQQISQARGAP